MNNFLDLPNLVIARSAPAMLPLLLIHSRFFGQARRLSTAVIHTPVSRATVRKRLLVHIQRTTIPFGSRVTSNTLGISFPASCKRLSPAVLAPLGSAFSQQLGEYHRSTRLQNTFSHPTTSLNRLHPAPASTVQEPTTSIGLSHSRPPHRTSDRTRAPPSTISRFCQPHVYHPEEGRRMSTSVQSTGTESICRLPPLQNGKHPTNLSYGTTWWLHDIDRFIRCLSSLAIHPEHRCYLRFYWKDYVYQFKTTPFGLFIAPYWFNKMTKPILEWIRQQGIRLSAYLDDWIILGKTKAEVNQHTQMMLQCLTSLGWLISLKKSQIQPTQILEHLGFELDAHTMTARLLGKKLWDLRKSIQQLIKQPTATPHIIQSVIMRIQAAAFAAFPARLYTQHLLQLKNHIMKSHPDWNHPHLLSGESTQELQWWLKNLKRWNGRSLLQH